MLTLSRLTQKSVRIIETGICAVYMSVSMTMIINKSSLRLSAQWESS